MKRTILTILAGSLAALTLGATAAHAEEQETYPRPTQQQRYDRDDRGDQAWRSDRPQRREEARRDRDRRDDRYREYDHDYRREARVDVHDCDRGVSIEIGGFLARR